MWIVYHIDETKAVQTQQAVSRVEADRIAGYWQDQGYQSWVQQRR